MRTNSPVFFLLLLFFSFNKHLCFAADTLSAGQSLYPNQTLVSAEGNFELGLFKPGTSSKYYFAMWYKKISVQNKTVVWVANRDDPFTDPSSSELKLLEDGNLVILNNQSNIPIWSTGSILDVMNSSELVLQDDGNLVLRGGSNPSVVFWQSFDHPTDTWLPGGKLRFDNRTKLSTPLTSWNNSENPGQGMFSLRLDPIEKEYSIRRNNSTRYWNSGPWDGRGFSLVPEMRENSIFNVSYISNENESYFTYDVYNTSMMSTLVMGLSGQVNQFIWSENTQSWRSIWTAPSQQCEVYMFCGAFSTCNQRGLPICECLPGFQPRFSSNWNLSDSSGGCVRKATLQCGDRDGFWLMENMKLPESGEAFLAENDQECRMNCLKKCSCNAYAFDNSTGTTSNCFSWNIDLLNMQVSDTNDSSRRDLYLRLAASEVQSLRKMRKESDERQNSGKGDADQNRNSPVETANHKGKTMIIIVVTVSAGVLVVGVLMYISWQCRTKRKERQKKKDMESLVVGRSNGSSESPDTSKGADDSELSVFNFEKLAIATNYFDLAHKLGEGGFGPVYKGKLSDGQEIAVKRLSKGSGQGLEEFKNEVVVISKLQHRNLVRLLGCCIQGDEKMLIYEYMPNKSLDSFIFDSAKQSVLDWTKRFEIIMGICRGILYLHRDSRLRVIHRDLKASNILLDRDLKPKISDFGMARIFGGDELQAKTLRVVGTYGYMSPEYAMKGVFSEKSDVYSFGVLLLELVSGKRNTLSDREQVWSLLGYAWILWSEGKTQELIHPAMLGSNNQEEIERCVHVGLLCVQDFPEDRPAMPSIVSMLTSETPILDLPERPVYTGREVAPDFDLSLENRKMWSRNNVLFTTMEGR